MYFIKLLIRIFKIFKIYGLTILLTYYLLTNCVLLISVKLILVISIRLTGNSP